MKRTLVTALFVGLLCFSQPFPSQAANLQNLKTSSNDPGGDYFIGSDETLKPVIEFILQDSSKLDAVQLYIAANTAFRLNLLSDSGFLFYAAQIRKAFDIQRFGLAAANGNNVTTYLGFLNQTIGEKINPTLMASPENFAKAIDKLETWNVVPAADANYPQKEYGKPAIPQKDWASLGASLKEDFLKSFGRKMKTFLSDPKNADAFRTVQDFNFGRLPKNPANQAKYDAALQLLQKSGVQ